MNQTRPIPLVRYNVTIVALVWLFIHLSVSELTEDIKVVIRSVIWQPVPSIVVAHTIIPPYLSRIRMNCCITRQAHPITSNLRRFYQPLATIGSKTNRTIIIRSVNLGCQRFIPFDNACVWKSEAILPSGRNNDNFRVDR
jgi:hypothetical protein